MTRVFRGGGWYGSMWPFLWQATWPFSTLEISENILTLKVFPLKAELLFSEIDSVGRSAVIPMIIDSIKINHHGKAPSNLRFWSINCGNILKVLQEQGLKIL